MKEDDLYQALGDAVATRRKELGLKQSDVAQKIGLSRASVANIEVGRQKVLLHHAYRLAAALDLPGIDALLPTVSMSREEVDPISFADVVGLTTTQRAQIESFVRVAKTAAIKRSKR